MNETTVTAAVAGIAGRDPAFSKGLLTALIAAAACANGASGRGALRHRYYMEHRATAGQLLRDFVLDKPAPWSSFLD